jgi:hypothetical protein
VSLASVLITSALPMTMLATVSTVPEYRQAAIVDDKLAAKP